MIGALAAWVGLALGLGLALLFIWLASGIRRIGAVSPGQPIEARAGGAVLLVDLQTVFWDQGPYPEAEKRAAETAILEAAAAAKAAGEPVIALRQEWSLPATKLLARLAMNGWAIAGTPGTEIAAPFAALPDHVIVKRVQDGFETGALDALLARLGIGELRIVGLDFNHCVAKTALAARQRGFETEIVMAGSLAAGPVARMQDRLAAAGVKLA